MSRQSNREPVAARRAHKPSKRTSTAKSAPRALIRTGTTVDDMVRAIADGIVDGRLQPGDRLDEVTLAEGYDVSRTPIREALRQLCALGLVERQPNRSAIVAVVTHEHLMSMFEAMAELEGICARLAAERMTPQERRAFEQQHMDSARLVELHAGDDYEAHNTEFHTRLYLGAHSKHIYELAVLTRSRLAPFRRAQFRLPGRLAKSWREHDAIVATILRGDCLGAEAAAKQHVSVVSEASATFAQNV